MEGRVMKKVQSMAGYVAEQVAQELAAAGTLVDLEELTTAIGDEISRQLCQRELSRRGELASKLDRCECPKCGAICPFEEIEPVVLHGLRGEIVYNQPRYYCRHCRRSFFPSGEPIGIGGAGYGDAAGYAEDGVGGKQPG